MFWVGVGTCGKDTCANQGTCDRVSASCDCDLTSFTGPRCTDGRRMHNMQSRLELSTNLREVFTVQRLYLTLIVRGSQLHI